MQVHAGCSDRAAAKHVNQASSPLHPHVLTCSLLQRMYAILPEPLTVVDTSSETLLIQHIHSQQSERQERRVEEHAMLKCMKEELLVQWVVREHSMNLIVAQLS